MKRFVLAILLTALPISTPAMAYVGPGAGLSLLGAFWALIVALGTAIIFVVAWPLRKALRRNRQAVAMRTEAPAEDAPATDTRADPTPPRS